MTAAPARAWAHQEEGRRFVHNLWKQGRRGAMLSMVMGCIDGDAEIIINRGGNARRYKFRDLYQKFNDGTWDRTIPSRTASLINGELRLNTILNVMRRGVMPVLKITLSSGKTIRVTPDHEIAAPGDQWIPAALLQPGSQVLVNGQPVCSQCGSLRSVATYRYAKHRGICRSCIARARHSKDRIIDKDGYVRLYGMYNHPRRNAAAQVYEHIVVMERILGRSITQEEQIHHINHNRSDNRPENLIVLPWLEHQRQHGKEGGYLHLDKGFGHGPCFVPRIDTVAAIVPDGCAEVYDLEMADPAHNFVANGILVHNSGKSRLAIDLINDLDAKIVLILCPLRVVEVWRAQFLQFSVRHYEFLALDARAGSVSEKWARARDLYNWARERDQRVAICINYEGARIDPFASWALRVPWPVVIADENHKAKQPAGRTAKFLARLALNSHYRLGLTGTPMPHSPLDVWAQYRFLDRNIFDPTFGSFKLRYARMGGYFGKQIIGWQNLDELYAKFRQIAFQVGESALDLPEFIDETLEADFSRDGARVYREMESEMVAWVEDMDGQGIEVTAANAMVRLQRLQQITGGSLPDEQLRPAAVDTAKEKLLAGFLEDVGGEPVVVFAVYKADLAAIHRAAGAAGLTSGEVSGSRNDLARWKSGALPPLKVEGEAAAYDAPQVLAVQIQSGGEGIDLTRARIAVYYSHGFSLAQYLQSRARIWRPPQKRGCLFVHLQVRNSIDQYVLQAVLARRDLVEGTLKGLRKN